MKNVKLYSMALAALMLGACSSDEVAVDGGQTAPGWNADGKGYVNLAINLPTKPNSRAWDEGSNLDDGTPAEYDVKDATLILFTGTEGTADGDLTLNSAYSMDLNFYTEGTTTDQITTTTKITQEINKIADDQKVIKALVVLNNNGVFSVNASNQLLINNNPYTGKLDELNSALKDVIGGKEIKTTANGGSGLLMANAVMADAQGGTVNPSGAKVVGPLVEIDPSSIKKNKADAEANPAASIYMERAVAKVTVTAKDGNLTVGEYEHNKLPYTILGWALDNTNETSKLVRLADGFDTWKSYASTHVTPSPDYRMVGGTAIAAGLYRTYWDKDYNYTGMSADATGLNTVGGPHATIASVLPADGETAGYCFENTTDLDNMLERNLTRVIVKAQFNDGKPFYTVDDERGTVWTENDVKKEVATRLLSQGDNTIYNWLKANVKDKETFTSEDLVIELSGEAAGKRTVKSVSISDEGKKKLKDESETLPANTPELANQLIALNYYADGVSYYPVYIKHFGDSQTPWDPTYNTGSTYGDSDADYLGRYGVLRNNWYEISVTGIKGLGSPNVDEVTGEPVDKVNYYISVNINVLSWAKRSQSVEL